MLLQTAVWQFHLMLANQLHVYGPKKRERENNGRVGWEKLAN